MKHTPQAAAAAAATVETFQIIKLVFFFVFEWNQNEKRKHAQN